jgi:hypothetical protein
MKQEALFRKLGSILAELNDQYQFLSQNPEHLSELELELFMANANFLVDHIQIIRKLNPALANEVPLSPKENTNEQMNIVANFDEDEKTVSVQIERNVEAEVVSPEPEVDSPELTAAEESMLGIRSNIVFEKLINSEPFEEDKFDFEATPTQQLYDRKLTADEERILEQKRKVKENLVRSPDQYVEDEEGPEPYLITTPTEDFEVKLENNGNTKPIQPTDENLPAEKIAKPSLNDILAEQNNRASINDTKQIVVTDLKTAISLNDKLLFVKVLFNGYNLAYSEAINLVNKMPNFDAADNFLQKNYAEKNGWSDKQEAVDKFYLILNRRFKD